MKKKSIRKLNKAELLELLLSRETENYPQAEDIIRELNRERYRNRYKSVIRSTIYVLVTVAALSVLIAELWLPVLKIYGSSMTPTLTNGELVVSIKRGDFKCGDIIAFYYGNKLLVKRCIAGPGDWVTINESGDVQINGRTIDEPYIKEKSAGESDIEYPYQVPEDKYFVLGDHRAVSADSRVASVGCVATEQIVGKIVLRVWPINDFGRIRGADYE